MKPGRLLALSLCLVAAGCVGTDEQLRILRENEAISLTPSTSPDYDYTVLIKNLRPLGVDPTLKADRQRIIAGYLGARCAEPIIVSETELRTTQPFLGDSSKDYASRVKC